MKYALLFLFSFLFISCQKDKPLTPQEKILGVWKSVPDSINGSKEYKLGYEFISDSICNFKMGYFDLDKYYKSSENSDFYYILEYLGTKTNYSVSKDTFKIFDKTENKWLAYPIRKFTADTLLIDNFNEINKVTLVKQKYTLHDKHPFDGIIVSGSPCFGSCPVNDILIEASGNVKYLGIDYVAEKGFKTSKITTEQFNEIAFRFYTADYFSLEKDYNAFVTDHSTISLVFLKDGKIIKSITDYGGASPTEFVWAYIPVIYLYQKLDFEEWEVPEYIKPDYFYRTTISNNKNEDLYLTDAEFFYLLDAIIKGKEVDEVFEAKYKLNFHSTDIENIFTDGRFFKFEFNNRDTKTIDIGFNFLESSNLVNTFEKTKQ